MLKSLINFIMGFFGYTRKPVEASVSTVSVEVVNDINKVSKDAYSTNSEELTSKLDESINEHNTAIATVDGLSTSKDKRNAIKNRIDSANSRIQDNN